MVLGLCLIAGAEEAATDNVQLLKAEKQLNGDIEAYKAFDAQRTQTAVIWQALNNECFRLEKEIVKLRADIQAMQAPEEAE